LEAESDMLIKQNRPTAPAFSIATFIRDSPD
jgi:hypothetical protein